MKLLGRVLLGCLGTVFALLACAIGKATLISSLGAFLICAMGAACWILAAQPAAVTAPAR